MIEPEYGDAGCGPRMSVDGNELPSARLVSNQLFSEGADPTDPKFTQSSSQRYVILLRCLIAA